MPSYYPHSSFTIYPSSKTSPLEPEDPSSPPLLVSSSCSSSTTSSSHRLPNHRLSLLTFSDDGLWVGERSGGRGTRRPFLFPISIFHDHSELPSSCSGFLLIVHQGARLRFFIADCSRVAVATQLSLVLSRCMDTFQVSSSSGSHYLGLH
jgi:hypothetical protein